MYRTLEELETIVRDRICSICSVRPETGECGRDEPGGCALFRLFPRVAAAVHSVDSDDIRDYVLALRRQVCSACESQARDGTCEERKQVRCALDAYLIPVVDALEEATGKRFDRKLLAPPPGGVKLRLQAVC
ncbi:MAG: hypothetical protein FJW20_01685 [Acidimicrobiia bacterium]|nr:hypothetical protein [Acidimicrobiia bacterium]